MNFTPQKTRTLILVISSLICSRLFYALLDDPEGPNLLIVVVLAVILYAASLLVNKFVSVATDLKKILVAIAAQLLLVAVLYFFLR